METKNKVILTTAIIFGFGFMISVPAQARNLRGACKADIEKVCKDIKPGDGRISDCLKDNIKKISKDCKEKIKNTKERRKNKKHKWGKNKHSKGKTGPFLRGYEKGFARGFAMGFEKGHKNKFNKHSKNRKRGIMNSCKADIKKLCGDIKHGDGRIKDCLEKNKKKLSKKCSSAFKKIEKRRKEGGERKHKGKRNRRK